MPRVPSSLRPVRVGAALAVGLVITVVISWAAMFVPHGEHGYGAPATSDLGLTMTTDESKIWQLSEGRNAWHHVVQYWHMQMSGVSVMIPTRDYEARRFDMEQLPRHLKPGSVDDLYMMAWYREVGFPWPALTCSVHWKQQVRNADIIYEVQGGWQLPRDKDFTPRALPLMPVWPGFFGNIILYAAVAWAVGTGLGAARRRWRERRGRCGRCGYPRTGLNAGSRCPECGTAPRSTAEST